MKKKKYLKKVGELGILACDLTRTTLTADERADLAAKIIDAIFGYLGKTAFVDKIEWKHLLLEVQRIKKEVRKNIKAEWCGDPQAGHPVPLRGGEARSQSSHEGHGHTSQGSLGSGFGLLKPSHEQRAAQRSEHGKGTHQGSQ